MRFAYNHGRVLHVFVVLHDEMVFKRKGLDVFEAITIDNQL